MSVFYALIILTCFIQLAFYTFVFSKFLFYKQKSANLNNARTKPISIVICAKNEVDNLTQYLPKILEQDYPTFEVIIVDDGSDDGTPALLAQMENQFGNLLVFRIEPNEKRHPGKKQALSYGVSLTKYEHIVVTDADCFPNDKNWLQSIAAPLNENADIVLGVSPYTSKSNPINTFFKMEAFSVAIQYINFTLAGVPFMGVGRNMAYKKKIFEDYDIEQHWDLVSGDDDLFVNAMAHTSKVALATEPQSFTFSDAPKDLSAWWRQKLRHYSTGYHYELIQKIWLGYYWTSSLLLYVLLFTSAILLYYKADVHPYYYLLVGATALTRWAITILSIRKLGEKKLNWQVPVLDFLYILSVWLVSPLSMISKIKWK